MLPIEQVERGIANYIDSQVMNRIPTNSIYRIIIGTSVAIAGKKLKDNLFSLSSNPIIDALGIMNNNMIDVDIILDELKEQIPDEGFRIEYNKFGKLDMIFTRADVDEMRRYIVRG